MTRYAPQWIQAGDYPANVDRRLIGALYPRAAVTGYTCAPSSSMVVNVAAGQAAIPTSNNSGTVLCTSDATEQATISPAPGAGTNRIDLIVVQARSNDIDGGTNNDFLVAVVTGSAAASPTVPATPANAVAVAQVYVPGASVTVTAPNITDVRPGRLDKPWNSAWGILTSALTVGPFNGPVTTEVDVPNMTGTVTVPAGRIIRTVVRIGYQSSVVNDVVAIRIKDAAGTEFAILRQPAITANVNYPLIVVHTEAIAAAQSLTRKVTSARDVGTGTVTHPASGTSYNQFSIED